MSGSDSRKDPAASSSYGQHEARLEDIEIKVQDTEDKYTAEQDLIQVNNFVGSQDLSMEIPGQQVHQRGENLSPEDLEALQRH